MLITNFASGELSPKLYGRQDLNVYYSGAGRLENFTIIPTGGIMRRAGTHRLAKLHGESRLIPFIVDSLHSYVLEILPNETEGSSVFVWQDGHKVLDDEGLQVQLIAPWNSLNEIKEIQTAQHDNVMILVQRDHAPQELKVTAGRWTLNAMTFDFSPDLELDDDYGAVYILKDAEVLPDTNVFEGKEYEYLAWKGKLYIWKDGAWILDDSTREYDQPEDLFTGPGKCPGAVAFFNSRLFFGGTRDVPQRIWGSAAPDIDGTRYKDFSTYVKYVTVNRVTKDADLHFFTCSAAKGSRTLTGVTQDLTGLEGYYVTGDNIPVGTQLVAFSWDESAKKGTATIDQDVVDDLEAAVLSCQKWKSRTAGSDDTELKVVNTNMTNAANAFYFELASDQNDGINWLASSKVLAIGTESAVYTCDQSLNALSTYCSLEARYGASSMQATVVNGSILFFTQGGKRIREFYKSQNTAGYTSQDLMAVIPELLQESPAVDFDYVNNPQARVIATRKDGTIAQMLFEKESGILAWSRVIFGSGKARSVAVTTTTSGDDRLWIAMEDGEDWWLETTDGEDGELDSIYLDGWQDYMGLTDGYSEDALIVNVKTGESWTMDKADEASIGDTYIGYPYKSLVKSVPIQSNDPTGKKRITTLLLRFYNSFRPTVRLEARSEDEMITDFEEPYSGIKAVPYPGDSGRDVTFTLWTEDPKPCNVLAVNAELAN